MNHESHTGIGAVVAGAFATPFSAQALLRLLRELFRRDMHAHGTFPIPLSYAKRIHSCTRIARVQDHSGDVLDVIVVRVALPKTFERHHSQLHALAVQAARYWVSEPTFQSLIIYEMPFLKEWRLQVVTSHVVTERQPNNTYKSQTTTSGMRESRVESIDVDAVEQMMSYFSACAQAADAATIQQLCEGIQTMPKSPAESVEESTQTIHQALNEQFNRLTHLAQQSGFAERAAINDQQRVLSLAAAKWEENTKQLEQLLRTQEQLFSTLLLLPPDVVEQTGGVQYGLNNEWQNTKPRRFKHEGVEYRAREWQMVFREVLHQLYVKHGMTFINAMNASKTANAKPFFAKTGDSFKSTRAIGVADEWFYETWLGANQINANIRRAYEVMNIPIDRFVVWVERKH